MRAHGTGRGRGVQGRHHRDRVLGSGRRGVRASGHANVDEPTRDVQDPHVPRRIVVVVARCARVAAVLVGVPFSREAHALPEQRCYRYIWGRERRQRGRTEGLCGGF